MAATGYTPISLYYSTTASTAPSSGNLVAGELALNTLDEKLYFKNSAGTVKLLASNSSSTGTVSSVGLSLPSIMAVTNSPVTTSGTLTGTLTTQAVNAIFAGPSSGAAAAPTFRALTTADIPALSYVTSVAATVPAFLSVSGSPITTSGTLAISYSGTALPVANGGTGLTSLTAGYIPFGAGTSAFSSSSSLFWDSANNRLGIGTTSPTAPLSVAISSVGASPTVTIANTDLTASGAVRANFLSGDDGTAGRTRALIEAAADGANNGRLSFYTRNAGTNVEQLRITYAGGISFGSSGTNYGTSGQVLTSAGNASPTWTTPTTGTVTSVGWTGGIVSIATATTTPAFTIAGTSGGIPYFSSGTTWATSAALAASAVVLGGGAGAAPATTTTGTGVVTAIGNAVNTASGFPTGSGTATLTNKRIDPRFSSTASTATLTPDISSFDKYNLTAQAVNLTVAAPTGTPVDGNRLTICILDNGTTRTISWNATYTVIGTTLPTATTANKMIYVGCIYNAANTRWDVVAVATQA